MVIVRRRWNSSETAAVSAECLWRLHVRNEPGGVCGALPRGFLCAYVWCDKLPTGAFGHVPGSNCPHDMLVFILPVDNAAALFERLRGEAAG
jgi:hypothetical protein